MKFFKQIFFTFFFVAASFVFFTNNMVLAADNPDGTSFPNPLAASGITTPQQFIGKIINSLLGIVGSIALLMFIYGGFIILTASGNEKAYGEGKNIIMWAALGLVVIFFSYGMVKFVFGAIGVM